MSARLLGLLIPIVMVLGTAGAEARGLFDATDGILARVSAVADCASERNLRLEALTETIEAPQPAEGTVRIAIPAGTAVAGVTTGQASGCGPEPVQTTVRFTDGRETTFPGEGFLESVETGTAVLRLR